MVPTRSARKGGRAEKGRARTVRGLAGPTASGGFRGRTAPAWRMHSRQAAERGVEGARFAEAHLVSAGWDRQREGARHGGGAQRGERDVLVPL